MSHNKRYRTCYSDTSKPLHPGDAEIIAEFRETLESVHILRGNPGIMATHGKTAHEETVAHGTIAKPLIAEGTAVPDDLYGKLDLSVWANSLINRTPYTEPDPEYLSRMLLTQTLMADDVDAVFAQAGIRKLQEAIPNVPNGGTGPIQIYDLYVTGSDFGEGAPCYMILSVRDLETGMESKYTTGATQLQAQILKLISLGSWPITCQIKRTERKDRGGRFLFWLFPPD
jgi:hypothetical protein